MTSAGLTARQISRSKTFLRGLQDWLHIAIFASLIVVRSQKGSMDNGVLGDSL